MAPVSEPGADVPCRTCGARVRVSRVVIHERGISDTANTSITRRTCTNRECPTNIERSLGDVV